MYFNELAPQERTVLKHLNQVGNITRVEADSIHKIRHLPTRIFNLRRAGCEITSDFKKDINEQRYVRYNLAFCPPKLLTRGYV